MPPPKVVMVARMLKFVSSPRTYFSAGFCGAGFLGFSATAGGGFGGCSAGFSLFANQAENQASRFPADQSAKANCVTWGRTGPIPGTPAGDIAMNSTGRPAHNCSCGSFKGGGGGGT